MNNPLDQETATPREKLATAITDAAATDSSPNTSAVTDTFVPSATLAGTASAEIDEAIRAIHGW